MIKQGFSTSARRAVAWLALGMTLVGCGEQRASQQSELQLLSVMYGQYRSSHRGELPKNEQQFKSFIASERGHVLTNSGISSVDALFVSRRDGQPYVLKYQNTKEWPLEEMVAYEQEGKDGTRQVANDMGGVAELTDEQFQAQIVKSRG